jgi:hypothetical protein
VGRSDSGPKPQEARLPPPREQPDDPGIKAAAPAHRRGCTAIWTGFGDVSRWSDPANWSTKHVPGESDRACLGPGTVITISADAVHVASIHDEGTLYLKGAATLSLNDLTHRSELNALVLENATLGGEATVVVRRLRWGDQAKMTGGGVTLLPRKSVAEFDAGDGGSGLIGPHRKLEIRGTFALQSGALYVDANGFIGQTHGHIYVNPYSPTHQPAGFLQRRNGRPLEVTGKAKLPPGVVTGTPGRQVRPSPYR